MEDNKIENQVNQDLEMITNEYNEEKYMTYLSAFQLYFTDLVICSKFYIKTQGKHIIRDDVFFDLISDLRLQLIQLIKYYKTGITKMYSNSASQDLLDQFSKIYLRFEQLNELDSNGRKIFKSNKEQTRFVLDKMHYLLILFRQFLIK